MTARLRVAVIVYDYPTPESPAHGRFLQRHVTAIACRHDVHVFQARLAAAPLTGRLRVENLMVDGVPVSRLTSTGPPVIGHLRLARVLREPLRQFDIIHSMSLESAFLASRAHGRRPWVHSEHSSEWTNPVATGLLRPWTALSRSSVARADAVTAVSSYLADGIRRQLGSRVPVTLWPNVLSLPRAVDIIPARERSPHEASDAEVRLIGVGYLVSNKHPAVALATLRELVDRGIDARMRWIGEGPLRDVVMAQARTWGLADRFEIAPFAEPAAYLSHVAAADVFLVPTAYETFFVSAAEAIAVGTPVVTGDVGGQRDFVDRSNGRLVHGDDPRDYADSVLEVLAMAWDAPRQVALIRQRFSVERAADTIDEVYRQLQAQ